MAPVAEGQHRARLFCGCDHNHGTISTAAAYIWCAPRVLHRARGRMQRPCVWPRVGAVLTGCGSVAWRPCDKMRRSAESHARQHYIIALDCGGPQRQKRLVRNEKGQSRRNRGLHEGRKEKIIV